MKRFLKENLFYSFVLIFVVCIGILNLYLPEIKKGNPELNNILGQKILMEGQIVEEPDVRDTNTKLTVRINKVKVLVTTNPLDEFAYGDRIKFEGILKKPENFMTDTGREFDYVSYLLKDGIYYEMRYPTIEIVSHGNGNPFISFLYRVKNSFLNNISKNVSDPEGSLMGGLLLGGKHAIDTNLQNDFIRTGVVHIVALSGFNITIIAEAVAGLFMLFFRKSLSMYLGIASIIIFSLMVGGGATVVRAAIMATLAFIARATGRTYDVTRALAIALVIMLALNPWILFYDVSFQLSFLATIGIIYLTPICEKYFTWAPKFLDLKNIMPTTLAAYVFVLPFVVYKMGTLSLVALPTNFLILPFIPITMFFGFFTGLFGFLGHIIVFPFSTISYFLLHYEISVVRFFSKFSFAALSIKSFSIWIVIACYALLLYFMYKKYPREKVDSVSVEIK